jgi:hypothetical protein
LSYGDCQIACNLNRIPCIVDGCPPELALSEADLQPDIDRRRTGTSHFVSQRREDDQVRILSGVLDGRTTRTPIGILSKTPMRARMTTTRSRTASVPVTRTTPINRSTGRIVPVLPHVILLPVASSKMLLRRTVPLLRIGICSPKCSAV